MKGLAISWLKINIVPTSQQNQEKYDEQGLAW